MYEEYLEQFVFKTAKKISQRLFGKLKSADKPTSGIIFSQTKYSEIH